MHFYNAKCDFYAVKCYITSNPKLPNIATLLELTIFLPEVVVTNVNVFSVVMELRVFCNGDCGLVVDM